MYENLIRPPRRTQREG